MRELTSHKVNGLNDGLLVTAVDAPGLGNANHVYDITPTAGNAKGLRIEFQNGPLSWNGGVPNGVSNEALLAIVEDRLAGFQAGEFAGEDNAHALVKVREAMMWLHRRTLGRVARGVEGTHSK